MQNIDPFIQNVLNNLSKPVLIINKDGDILFYNQKCLDICPEITFQKHFFSIFNNIGTELTKTLQSGEEKFFTIDYNVSRGNNNSYDIRLSGPDNSNHTDLILVEFLGIHTEIATMKHIDLLNNILFYANQSTKINQLLDKTTELIRDYSTCEAVGIRLLDKNGNIPYESYHGFPASFYETESPLSIKCDHCMCINVIKGDIDSTLPFYTNKGSFFMNATTAFLSTVSDEEKGATRNVCNQYGYESVALVPIKLKNEISGLIHIADTRENKVPIDLVDSIEYVALHIGESINRIRDHEKLLRNKKNLQSRLVKKHKAAIKSEHRFKQLFALNPIPSYIWEYDGNHFYLRDFNQVGSYITNDKISSYLGKNELDIHGDEPEILKAMSDCIQEKKNIRLELKRTMKTTQEIKYFTSYFTYIEPNLILVLSDDVTSLKIMENELREKQQYLTSVITALPDIVLTIDKLGTVLDAYFPAMQEYPLDASVFINNNIRNLGFPDELVSGGLDRIHVALKNQKPQTHTFIYTNDSKTWYFESRIIPVDSEKVISIVRDVTDSQKLTRELQKSRKSLEKAEQVAKTGNFELNFDSGDVYWSNETFRIFDFDPLIEKEPSFEEYKKLIHTDDLPHLTSTLNKSLEKHSSFNLVYRIVTQKGNLKYVHNIGDFVHNESNQSIMFGTFQDVTEEKIIENNLRQTEEQFRLLIEASPNLVMIVQDGKYVYGNRECKKVLGYSESELNGLDVMKTIAPEYHDIIIQRMKQKRKTKEPIEIETIRKDGSRYYSESTSVPIIFNKKPAFLIFSKNITERKEYMDKLLFERDRLLSVFNGIPAFVYMQKKDYTIDFANNEFVTRFGSVEGKKCYEILHNYKSPCKDCKTFNAFACKGICNWEWDYNGKYYMIFDTYIPATEVSEEMVLEIGFDITNQKETEIKFRESEKRYRNLYSKTPVMLHSINNKGEIVEVSDYWLKRMGYSRKEVINRKSITFLTPESQKIAKDIEMPKFFDKGYANDVYYQFKTKDKDIFDVLMSAISDKDEQGRVIKSYAVSIDVTEQMKAQRLLKESEEKFRTLSEQSVLGIVILQDFHLKYANKTFFDLFAIDPIPIDKFDFLEFANEFIYPDDVPLVEASSIIINPQVRYPHVTTIRIIDGNNTKKWLQGYVNLIAYEENQATMVNLVDITEMTNTRKELEKSQTELRNLYLNLQHLREQERKKVALEIHDQLGQNLAVLKMDAHWIKKNSQLVDKKLEGKIESMLQLIDNSIMFVKQVMSDLHPRIIDHLGLVAAMEEQIELLRQRMDIVCDVNFKVEDDLDLDSDLKIAIFRIFQETLTNIVKHSQASHVKITVEIEDSFLILNVCDDGIGITEKDLQNPSSFGIKGMKERLVPFNGSYEMKNNLHKGTCTILRIPYPN